MPADLATMQLMITAMAAAMAFSVLLVAVTSLVASETLVRVVIAAFVYSFQALLVARVAIRIRPPAPIERGAALFAAGTCAIGLLYLLRAAFLLLGASTINAVEAPGTLDTVNHVMGMAAIVVSTLGFLLMPFERRARRYRKQAGTDALTRIANRRGMAGAIDECFDQAARDRQPLAVLMLDLDHFKRLNDAHGHSAGDAYLRAVADSLRSGVRRDDLLGRHGGEEFLVVLPRTGTSEALEVADQLRARVAALAVPWQGQTLATTVSIGVATAVPTGPADRAALIDAADQALYAAKKNGRNRVEVSGASI